MKILYIFLLITIGFAQPPYEKLTLSSNGISKYKIIIPQNADRYSRLAATELQKYIKEISEIEIPLLSDNTQKNEYEIIIGKNNRTDLNTNNLGEDGFIIKTVDKKLFISGDNGKSTLYGVYSFLENYLGCRKYTFDVIKIPKMSTVEINPINDKQIPKIRYRRSHNRDAYDESYALWHKLDSDSEGVNIWGMFVHTFNTLVPPEKYFKEHPEYYAMMNGIRIVDQLCLSNPDVFTILVDNLHKKIAEKPSARIWSVSQNDNFSYCRCPECSIIDEQEGSPSGSLLRFVNKVAAEFPDKIISTLAYQYTRSAPKTYKPAENVNIVLCSIECNRHKPIAQDLSSASFVKDLRDWSLLTDNLMIWDYVIQFKNMMSPFPNLSVLQPNIQLFIENNGTMMFQQGNTGTGELVELRGYLIAKLLWDPYINIDSVMNDFLTGYYGVASTHIRKYIDTMHDALEKSGEELWIYGNPIKPRDGYLSPHMIDRYNIIFDDAEQSVQTQPEILARVKQARLPLQYAMLEQAKVLGTNERGYFRKNVNGTWEVDPKMKNLFYNFITECNKLEKVLIEESGYTPDKYKASVEKMLSRSMKPSLSLFKPVSYIISWNKKYLANGDSTLTDGLRGIEDYNYNWLGWEADDCIFVVDLGEAHQIKKISTDFLQDINAWIFLPKKVTFQVSTNGTEFTTVSELTNKNPEDKWGAFTETFESIFPQTEARYIKVHAANMKVCPPWHKGFGGKPWVFVDEIIVE